MPPSRRHSNVRRQPGPPDFPRTNGAFGPLFVRLPRPARLRAGWLAPTSTLARARTRALVLARAPVPALARAPIFFQASFLPQVQAQILIPARPFSWIPPVWAPAQPFLQASVPASSLLFPLARVGSPFRSSARARVLSLFQPSARTRALQAAVSLCFPPARVLIR